MSKASQARHTSQPNNGPETPSSPAEMADYIHDTVKGLAAMAHSSGLVPLAYVLDMAQLERRA